MVEDSGALQEQLRSLDAEVAEIRQTVTDLRRGIGERSNAPVDAADMAAAITAAEEQEAVLKLLEAKRDDVQRRLSDG
jgi:hypothetical protein